MRLLQVSTLSNQNISSALLAATFTALRAQKLIVNLFADQVAGNGDYIAYLTLQKAGAGSAYILMPKTTATAAAGETAIAFPSMHLAVGEADVLKVYIDGLAGDTTTPDLRVELWDADSGGTLLDTTIATLDSQTSFTLTEGSADNDAYNGCVIVIHDATTWRQMAVGVVADYTGAGKTVALLTDPAVFTMAAGDAVTVLADRALKSVVDNRRLVVDANGLGDANTVKVGPTGIGTAQTARDLGLALPAAAPDAAGGLPISDAGGLDLDTLLARLDAVVSSRAPESGGNIATLLGRIIGTLAAGTHTAQSGDAYARLGANGAGLTALGDARLANLDAALSVIAAYVDELESRLTAARATKLDNLDAAVSTRSSHSAADVKTALEANGSKLDHLWEMTEDDAGVRRLTTNALELAPGGAAAGAGAITWTYTLTRSDTGAPIDGAEVWVTTDSAGANVIASGMTDAFGIVTFYLDPGNYYVFRKKAGYNFTNPDPETVT